VYFLSVGGDGVDLIDEYDGGALFLGLFESFAEVAFGFSGHFRHDFWSVDEEEEGAGLIGDGSGD
jgi:hypothetical protein